MPDSAETLAHRIASLSTPAAALLALLAAASPLAAQTPQRFEDQRLTWNDEFSGLPPDAEFGRSLATTPQGPGLALIAAPDGAGWCLFRFDGDFWTLDPFETYTSPAGQQPYALAPDGELFAMARKWSDSSYRIWPHPELGDPPLAIGLSDRVEALAKHGGNTFAVGMPSHGAGSDGQIVVYGWSNQFGWVVEKVIDGGDGERLGQSLALRDANVLVAGAPGYGDNGAIKIYVRVPGDWVEFQVLESPAISQTGAEFGDAVAAAGPWIAVGSPLVDRVISPGALTDVGAVYIYKVGFAYDYQTLLRPPGANDFDRFGTSVALSLAGDGNALVIAGSPFEAGDSSDEGAVYVYRRDGEAWRPKLRLRDSLASQDDRLGIAVAVSPHGLLAGAPNADANAVQDQGVVLYFADAVPFFYDGFESEDVSRWSTAVP